MTNRVNFSVIPFPTIQWSGDIFQLASLLADHLQGDLDQTVFTGQYLGSEPSTDIGLWFNDGIWKWWNDTAGQYAPARLVAGIFNSSNGNLHIAELLASNTTSDIQLTLPDKSGTLALTGLDQATITLATASVSLDWSAQNVYDVMPGNVTVTDAGGANDGDKITLWLETPVNTGTAFTLTLPNTWRHPTITLSTTDATHRAVDQISIRRIGTHTFAYKVTSYQIDQAGADGDTSDPTFDHAEINSGGTTMSVYFSELIRGTTPTSAWDVKKNGVSQLISSTKISNNRVYLILANPITATDILTVQYISDGSVLDFAANAALSFGPSPVNVLSSV